MDINGKLYKRFLKRQEQYIQQHGETADDKQKLKGKLTARERIGFLFDSDTFEEVDAFSSPLQVGGSLVKLWKLMEMVLLSGMGGLQEDWHLCMPRILRSWGVP